MWSSVSGSNGTESVSPSFPTSSSAPATPSENTGASGPTGDANPGTNTAMAPSSTGSLGSGGGFTGGQGSGPQMDSSEGMNSGTGLAGGEDTSSELDSNGATTPTGTMPTEPSASEAETSAPAGENTVASGNDTWAAASAVFQVSCVGAGCHVQGGHRPLLVGDEASVRPGAERQAARIASEVTRNAMPPQGGLSEADKQAIAAWAASL